MGGGGSGVYYIFSLLHIFLLFMCYFVFFVLFFWGRCVCMCVCVGGGYLFHRSRIYKCIEIYWLPFPPSFPLLFCCLYDFFYFFSSFKQHHLSYHLSYVSVRTAPGTVLGGVGTPLEALIILCCREGKNKIQKSKKLTPHTPSCSTGRRDTAWAAALQPPPKSRCSAVRQGSCPRAD